MKKLGKRIMLTTFNILMLTQLIISGYVLGHDLFIWGIKPLFTGHFILLTYFGMFIDFLAIGLFYIALEHFKKLFS